MMKYDYLIGRTPGIYCNMTSIAGGVLEHKIYKLLEFTNRGGDISDPWYTGNFDETYTDVMEGCQALLEHILKEDME